MKHILLFGVAILLTHSPIKAQLKADSIAAHHNLQVVHNPVIYRMQVAENHNFELVELVHMIPNLGLDIKYATADNFAETPVYQEARAFARKPVAEALVQVQNALAEYGLELLIFDAYRPYSVTVKFFEIYPDPTFVADPAKGSRHNRGCAVDVTLVNSATGLPLEMPTAYDDFTERAHPNYQELPEDQRKNRDFLIRIMADNGFTVYPSEWWHFDFVGWEHYPLMDIPFEEL
jgi:zinc D-Ala-D-Ala dipeptidase